MAAFAWRSRPVFVSSTFADMHAERDHLRHHVFPELEERLRERYHHLEPVDLRWGVETVSVDEQHAKEMLVLKVCLEEINRCRPFVLVLLGDRYGWVPPRQRMQAAVDEAGFSTDVACKSVTALEIEYGVLGSPQQQRRSYFYFREPLPYDAMPPEVAALYSEAHNPAPGAADAAERLSILKARIEADPRLSDRVHRYQAQWDSQRQRVAGLDSWGRRVLEDLWRDLQDETSDFARSAQADWRHQERWTLEEFVEDRGRGFIGRVAIIDELVALAMSPAQELLSWGACLTGESGAGKSALFAHLHRQFEDRHDVLLLAHAAGISPRSTQVDAMLRRWIEELAQRLGSDNPLTDDASAAEVDEVFRTLLAGASRDRRVVVLIDALNQFEPTSRAHHLTWLPERWPENARLIATTIPGTASTAAERRGGIEMKMLPVLNFDEAEHIAVAVCQRYHRRLHPDLQRLLLAKRLPDGRASAGIPLWLELALEELNLLDADDFERAQRDYHGSPEEKLHRMMLDVASGLPGDVPGLYGYLLRRCEELHGRGWARAFASLIAISREGWREADLRELLPRAARVLAPNAPVEAWSELKFAALRRSFRAHLKQQGVSSQWDFFHTQMRQAVERQYLAEPGLAKRLHVLVSDHLAALAPEDPLRQSESMFHLIGSDDIRRAAQYYAGLPRASGAAPAATRALANHIIRGAADAEKSHLKWALSLLDLADLNPHERAKLCRLYGMDLLAALENDTDLATRLIVLRMVAEVLEQLWNQQPENDLLLRELSVCQYRMGDLLSAQGDLTGALACCRASLEIAQRLARHVPGDFLRQGDLSVSHIKIGDIFRAQGDLPAAQDAYQASLEICHKLAGQDSGNAQWQVNLALGHHQIGDVLSARGDLTAALTSFGASQEIMQRLVRQSPANLSWQQVLASIHNSIGQSLRARGDLAAALAAYQTGLGIFQRLAALDPANVRLQTDLLASQSRIGDVLSAQGDSPGALAASRADLAIAQRLVSRDPGNATWQSNVAAGYGNVGDDLSAQGDLAGALAAYRASHEIVERLARADQSHAGFQFQLSTSHGKIGSVLLAQGDLEGALEAYREGLEIRRRLASHDTSNAAWQRNLAVSHNNVGLALGQQEDFEGALAAFRAAHEIFTRLAGDDPSNASAQRDLAVNHIRIGEMLESQGEWMDAMASFRAAAEICTRLARQDPSNSGWQMNLAGSQVKIGDVLLEQGDYHGALAVYREALAVCQRSERAAAGAMWNHNMYGVNVRIGDVLSKLGDLAGAMAAYRAALDVCQPMARQDPSDVRWRDQMAEIKGHLFETYCSTWPAVVAGLACAALVAVVAILLAQRSAWFWVLSGPLLALSAALGYYQGRRLYRRLRALALSMAGEAASTPG